LRIFLEKDVIEDRPYVLLMETFVGSYWSSLVCLRQARQESSIMVNTRLLALKASVPMIQ